MNLWPEGDILVSPCRKFLHGRDHHSKILYDVILHKLHWRKIVGTSLLKENVMFPPLDTRCLMKCSFLFLVTFNSQDFWKFVIFTYRFSAILLWMILLLSPVQLHCSENVKLTDRLCTLSNIDRYLGSKLYQQHVDHALNIHTCYRTVIKREWNSGL